MREGFCSDGAEVDVLMDHSFHEQLLVDCISEGLTLIEDQRKQYKQRDGRVYALSVESAPVCAND